MSFAWPSMLFALLLVPVLIAAYMLLQRRQQVLAESLGRFGAAYGARRNAPGFRRHLPPLLLLLGVIIILVALARPQATVNLPRVEGTVLLVIDVSASMSATDVEPSRLEAAKQVARDFVLSQPPTVQIGIVSFSGSGFAVQPPSNDPNALLGTIDRLQPARGTSLGQGIAAALTTIAVDAGLMPEDTAEEAVAAAETGTPGAEGQQQGGGLPQDRALERLPEGRYPASVIVLLSDGEDNESINPLQAATVAAERGVRIDALGFGTAAGVTLEVDEYLVHTALNEPLLQQITEAAGGKYYPGQGPGDRSEVYANLAPELVVKPETMEITGLLAGASIVLLLAGSLFSVLWFNRLP